MLGPHLNTQDLGQKGRLINYPQNFCLYFQMHFMIYQPFVCANSLLIKTCHHLIPLNYFVLLLLGFLVKGTISCQVLQKKQFLRFRRRFRNYQLVMCTFWARHRFHLALLVSLTFIIFMNLLLVLIQVIAWLMVASLEFEEAYFDFKFLSFWLFYSFFLKDYLFSLILWYLLP